MKCSQFGRKGETGRDQLRCGAEECWPRSIRKSRLVVHGCTDTNVGSAGTFVRMRARFQRKVLRRARRQEKANRCSGGVGWGLGLGLGIEMRRQEAVSSPKLNDNLTGDRGTPRVGFASRIARGRRVAAWCWGVIRVRRSRRPRWRKPVHCSKGPGLQERLPKKTVGRTSFCRPCPHPVPLRPKLPGCLSWQACLTLPSVISSK